MKKLVVAAGVVSLLVVGAAVAYSRGSIVVTVALHGFIIGLGALAAIDANQKARWQQRHLTRWQKTSEQRLTVVEDELLRRGARAEVATKDDVLGTVKLLQEQYVGRLDQAQAQLEQATAALRAAAGPTRSE